MRSSLFGSFVVTFGLGCSSGSSTSPAKEVPAKIQNPRTEADLSTITLSPQAVKRLGIETVAARQDVAASTRTLGGEVVVPEGRSVIVTAPVAGTLIGSATPVPGARVRKGDPLMTIAPLVSAERDQRIEAQRALTAAEAEELAARQRLQRLEQLLKDGAASVRGVEEARAQHHVAVAAVTAGRDRLAGVARNPVGAHGELIVSAPFDGVVQRISAVPGQTVAASAALLEIAHVDTLWVRVSVYAGDATTIDHAQHASVTRLGDGGTPARATPVVAPLRADASAASVDLHYAVAQSQPALRPGERVLVELPMRGNTRGLVVPEAAILYDIHGATWVYEDLGSNAYARRRVEVERHAGDRVVVSRGIGEGAKVVTTGSPELFGTEFGAGH